MKLLILTALCLTACSVKQVPKPLVTVDIYTTEDGIYVVTDGKQTIGYRITMTEEKLTKKNYELDN